VDLANKILKSWFLYVAEEIGWKWNLLKHFIKNRF